MKTRYLTYLSTLFLISCGPSDTAKTKWTREYNGETGMDFGKGYSAIVERVRGECVDFAGTSEVSSGQQTTYKLDLIESNTGLARSMDIGIEGQFKALVGDFSAKTRFVSDHAVNNYSVYLLVSSVVKNQTSLVQKAKLKEEIQKNLIQDKSYLAHFRQQCGDRFISGITTGGEYYGVIEIKTNGKSDKNALSASLQASGALGKLQLPASGGVSASVVLDKVLKGRAMTIWSNQKGGAGEDQKRPTSVEEMMERAANMPVIVKDPKAAFPISATFTDYLSLGVQFADYEQFNAEMDKARAFMGRVIELQEEVRTLEADLNFVVDNSWQFDVSLDEAPLSQESLKKQIRIQKNALHVAATNCYNKTELCEISSLPVSLNLTLPKRKDDVPDEPVTSILIPTPKCPAANYDYTKMTDEVRSSLRVGICKASNNTCKALKYVWVRHPGSSISVRTPSWQLTQYCPESVATTPDDIL